MYQLSRTNRCKLFEDIADTVWNNIIYNHRVGVQVREEGPTNDIIAQIRNNALSYPNIGLWANNAYNEPVHGNDIDIFVETTNGNFVWWALQAKVLKVNQTYEGIATLRGGEYQWDKLNRLAKNAGCIVRYLLYNGVRGYNISKKDSCNRSFNAPQFGCSLVKTDEMERKALQPGNPRFKDFHPELADPWRVITCCRSKIDGGETTLFSFKQLKNALDYYPEVIGNKDVISDYFDNEKSNNYSDNVINDMSEKIERKPFYRMVIRTTSSLQTRM